MKSFFAAVILSLVSVPGFASDIAPACSEQASDAAVSYLMDHDEADFTPNDLNISGVKLVESGTDYGVFHVQLTDTRFSGGIVVEAVLDNSCRATEIQVISEE